MYRMSQEKGQENYSLTKAYSVGSDFKYIFVKFVEGIEKERPLKKQQNEENA